MKRYSFAWWLVILPTSVTVGGSLILLTSLFTDWTLFVRLAVAALATGFADLAIAAWMESIAPTRVHVGPGEKYLVTDPASERAMIISGFDSVPHGHVSIRGEIWRAIRAPGDTGALTAGMLVSVVDRDGLTLIVTSTPR